jgi:hypothetical protein
MALPHVLFTVFVKDDDCLITMQPKIAHDGLVHENIIQKHPVIEYDKQECTGGNKILIVL